MTPKQIKQLREERNRILREDGFHDLEPTDDPTRRGLSRKGLTMKMESLTPDNLLDLGASMQVIRQLVEDPTTPWPSPMHRRMAVYLGHGFGRVEIENAMGDEYPGWRAQGRVVKWIEGYVRQPGSTREYIARQLCDLTPRELVQLAASIVGGS